MSVVTIVPKLINLVQKLVENRRSMVDFVKICDKMKLVLGCCQMTLEEANKVLDSLSGAKTHSKVEELKAVVKLLEKEASDAYYKIDYLLKKNKVSWTLFGQTYEADVRVAINELSRCATDCYIATVSARTIKDYSPTSESYGQAHVLQQMQLALHQIRHNTEELKSGLVGLGGLVDESQGICLKFSCQAHR